MFEKLPQELFDYLFNLLNRTSQGKFSLTCKEYQNLTLEFWKREFSKNLNLEFPNLPKSELTVFNFKNAFLAQINQKFEINIPSIAGIDFISIFCFLKTIDNSTAKNKEFFFEELKNFFSKEIIKNLTNFFQSTPGSNLLYATCTFTKEIFADNKLALQGQIEFVKLLLEKNVDVNCKINLQTSSGKQRFTTPLHAAIDSKNYVICKMLLKKGADVNAQDDFDHTALHLAVSVDLQIFYLVLSFKPNPFIKNKLQKTPYQVAADEHKEDRMALLKDYEAEWSKSRHATNSHFF